MPQLCFFVLAFPNEPGAIWIIFNVNISLKFYHSGPVSKLKYAVT